MQSKYWDDFYQSGRVSDYLKYVNSAGNTADRKEECSNQGGSSCYMESVQYAGKSDGNGAFGHTGW